MSTRNGVVEMALLRVYDAQLLLNRSLGRIQSTGSIVRVTSNDSLFLQYNDICFHGYSLYGSSETGTSGTHHNDVARRVVIGHFFPLYPFGGIINPYISCGNL